MRIAKIALVCAFFSLSSVATNHFRITPEGGYGGLSQEGLLVLKAQRDRIRNAHAYLNSRLRHSRSAIHSAFVARLAQGHMFLYGPPGGAKSMLARELLLLEDRAPFKIQLHQAMTDQPLVGGQDFDAARRGEYVINSDGSLATFKTALLDELDKASPSVLSVLLGLMNEREVQVGRRVIKAVLQSIFATSNAILPEIFEAFRENGQLSTAAALLNRFQFKTCLYNWLPQEDQEVLSRARLERFFDNAAAEGQVQIMTQPEPIDWDTLRKFAAYIMRFSPNALKAYTRLVNQMRAVTNHEVDASRTRYLDDPDSEIFVYFPTADYSERLRQIIPESVIYSAFIDFLLSPLANDDVLDEGFLNQQIELQPSSLWRGYVIQTTVFSGEATLQNTDGKFFIHFANKVDKRRMRDSRERATFKMIEREQGRFKYQYAQVANFKCTKGLSTGWLDPKGMQRQDIEELLQPNPESDRIRKAAFETYVPCEDELPKPRE